MPTALTIGHSTRTWEAFLGLLRRHNVRRVIDVRTIPCSLRNPQFNRDILKRRLRSVRIGYVHLKKLGGLRHPHSDSANIGWHNLSFRGFADYMQTEQFEAGLRRLIELAREKRCALMCAEAVPWRCHRSLIADALTVRGLRVEHILSGKSLSVHRITPFACVADKRLTYPIPKKGVVHTPCKEQTAVKRKR
jgi:uncharacterized protein (DUF488 family)